MATTKTIALPVNNTNTLQVPLPPKATDQLPVLGHSAERASSLTNKTIGVKESEISLSTVLRQIVPKEIRSFFKDQASKHQKAEFNQVVKDDISQGFFCLAEARCPPRKQAECCNRVTGESLLYV